MSDLKDLIQKAGDLILQGDNKQALTLLKQLESEIAKDQSLLSRPDIAAGLERLKRLSNAALSGAEQAQTWLAELMRIGTHLSAYDKDGSVYETQTRGMSLRRF